MLLHSVDIRVVIATSLSIGYSNLSQGFCLQCWREAETENSTEAGI
jgi:hypothetical protein